MNAVLTIPCDTKRRAIIIAHGAHTRQGGFVWGKGPFNVLLLHVSAALVTKPPPSYPQHGSEKGHQPRETQTRTFTLYNLIFPAVRLCVSPFFVENTL